LQLRLQFVDSTSIFSEIVSPSPYPTFQTDLVVDCHIFGLVCNMPSHLLVFPSRGSHGYLSFEIVQRFGARLQLRLQFIYTRITCTELFDTPNLSPGPCCFISAPPYSMCFACAIFKITGYPCGLWLLPLPIWFFAVFEISRALSFFFLHGNFLSCCIRRERGSLPSQALHSWMPGR
jgi:hypothetical protein